jgi:predicted esterase YcpF (UPF0227 family)
MKKVCNLVGDYIKKHIIKMTAIKQLIFNLSEVPIKNFILLSDWQKNKNYYSGKTYSVCGLIPNL